MWRSCIGGLFCLAIVACETTPAAVILTPAEFDSAVAEANGKWHPWLTIESLTETLDTATLSSSQRARLLVERGSTRREAGINLPGAISDFSQALSLTVENDDGEMQPALGANARADAEAALEYVESDFEEVRTRLAGVQTLQEWFSDKVASGDIVAGVERYKASGLAPEIRDARLLEAAGYLCADDLENDQDWELGHELDYLKDLEWCEITAMPAS
ncbi:hypothetical protein [Henriciella sp.]|uniref:hypothetical protein n=1 Tax=Henriciella sp. TaxID=1968823 RepID=UPI0026099DB1|nr:hypothetical protein [Henriciella sp.]